ncbi:MAG: glycosyltransferase family 2 protein [Pseudomonadota bacterium]
MKLLIAIPALNEEQSIASIVERCLEARPHIVANSPINEVEITVVSDGSTDRTVEIASNYKGKINLLVFEKNRGYGAAIKEAWSRSDADVLGFLDADGTCDPLFFADLCMTLDKEQADVVLGCRLNPKSQMPLVRKIGNIIFATMLTALSSTRVKDTASGMRVVRRESLPKLMPLPDGLQFTPAMSARAILSDELKITEIDMPYCEREGESKLRAGKDGLRFLKAIWSTAYLYRPSRPQGFLALLFLLAAVTLMISPVFHYLAHRSLKEWMIYRFVVSHLLGMASCLLFCTSYISRRIVKITLSASQNPKAPETLLETFFGSRLFWYVPLALSLAGGILVWPSFVDLVRTGHVYEHWSRFIAMSFFLSVAFILSISKLVAYALDLIDQRMRYLRGPKQKG